MFSHSCYMVQKLKVTVKYTETKRDYDYLFNDIFTFNMNCESRLFVFSKVVIYIIIYYVDIIKIFKKKTLF